MDILTLAIMVAVLFIAWILPPIIVVEYCKVIVPKRYDEMKEQLTRKASAEIDVVKDDRRNSTKSAAWHYAHFYHPDSAVDDEESAIRDEFWYYHDWKRYATPLCLIVVLSGLMLAFTGLWVADRLRPAPSWPAKTALSLIDSQAGMISRVEAPFVMALLGALTWSLFEIVNRRRSGDLTPMELNDVVLRFVTAIPVGYAFSLLVFETVSPWLAFVVSAFPLRDVRQLIRKQTLRKIGETPLSINSTTNKGYIGQVTSDIGDDTIVRLEELNIVTCMDLAYTDPIKLMIKTGAPILLVLAWIDKALLAFYAAPHVRNFERLGLPCALDICEFYIDHCWNFATEMDKNWADDQAVKELAEVLKVPREILVRNMLQSIFNDPQTQFLIRAWYGPAEKNGL